MTAAEAGDGLTRSLPGAVVCISVGVTKASGLQVLYLQGCLKAWISCLLICCVISMARLCRQCEMVCRCCGLNCLLILFICFFMVAVYPCIFLVFAVFRLNKRSNSSRLSVTVSAVAVLMWLQTSAMLLTRHDPTTQYSAEVGVNSYVRIMLSFLRKEVSSLCLLVRFTSDCFLG